MSNKTTSIEDVEVKVESISVLTVTKQEMRLLIKGTSPLILNKLSKKAGEQLLCPQKKLGKKAADIAAAPPKHNPLMEFRGSAHTLKQNTEPTYLAFPAGGMKKAIANSALDLPNTNKSQIGRLLWVVGEYIPIYGMPYLYMTWVRNSDINRTPDIRTRVIVPKWATEVTVSFATPLLNKDSVLKLIAASGIFCGLGDYRAQKSGGGYGQYEIATSNDEELRFAMQTGRSEQIAAMEQPSFYDGETEELYEFWLQQTKPAEGRAAATAA